MGGERFQPGTVTVEARRTGRPPGSTLPRHAAIQKGAGEVNSVWVLDHTEVQWERSATMI